MQSSLDARRSSSSSTTTTTTTTTTPGAQTSGTGGAPAQPPSTDTGMRAQAAAPGTTSTAAGSGGSEPSVSGTSPGEPGMSATTGSAGAGTQATSGDAGRSGSAADSGGAGAAADPAASGTCAGSLCESFENMTASTLGDGWELATRDCMGTGSVEVDSTQAHSGSRSVRVSGGGGYCNHVFFRPTSATWSPEDPLYARFYVRFEKPLTQSHVTFLAMHDEQEMKDLRMGGQSEILMWNRESDDATLPELSPTGIATSVKPPIGQWLCVELAVDGAAAQLQTWLDGEPVAGLIVEGEPTPDIDAQWQRKPDWRPMLSDIRFGWESYGSDENTLWFDDIALSSSRIGCDP